MEKSPLKPVPSGSLPSPTVGVNGEPLVAVMMVPSSQPPSTYDVIPEDFGPGTSQITVPVKVCLTSKSQAPIRYDLTSKSGTATEFTQVSPVTGAELVSRQLP